MKAITPESVRVQGLSEVSFDFLNAKLRGRRSFLYEGARLRELAELPSLQELAWHLYPRQDIRDVFELERRMLGSCVRELAWVLLYLRGSFGVLYRALLDRYIVENLKVLLRLFARKDEAAAPADYLIDLPPGMALPVEELLASADVEEFLARVPLAAVRACAETALPLYRESGRRAFLEMAFDCGYWQAVQEAVAQLSAIEQSQCSAPILAERDAMRLLSALRAAGVYGLPWEEFSTVLPAGGRGLGLGTLREVYGQPELEFAVQRVPGLAEAVDRHRPAEQVRELGDLEDVLWHEVIRLANRQYYARPAGPAVVVSYFYLVREELRHLLALAQMLRVGRPAAEIAERLHL